MHQKQKIAAAGNVIVPAYLTLRARGYTVCCCHAENGEEVWTAENESRELVAGDVLSLLGLAALSEVRGHRWQASDEEIDDFFSLFKYGSDT